MVGFDTILTGLKEITRQDHSSSSSQGHSSGYDSDSDTSAEAVRAAQTKAAKENVSKTVAGKKRKKSTDADTDSKQKASKKIKKQKQDAAVDKSKIVKKAAMSSSSESASESDGEAGTTAAAAGVGNVSRVRAATHLGRYQKREVAKTVRNYSASDLAAILGLPDAAPTAASAEGAAGWAALTGISNPAAAADSSSSSSDDDSSSSDSDDDQNSSEQRLRPGTPPGSDTPQGRVLHTEQQAGNTTPAAAVGEHEAADVDESGGSVWWRSVFVRGGRSGSSAGPSGKTKINISGFQEDDQANLYLQVSTASERSGIWDPFIEHHQCPDCCILCLIVVSSAAYVMYCCTDSK